MKAKLTGRIFRLLLCTLLCMTMAVPLSGTALAFDGSNEEQSITIHITPPTGVSEGSAAVEICITDNVGAGFQSAQVKAGGKNWRDVTTELAQTENRWCCVEDITENCTIQVRVIGLDGMAYEKSEYIQCFAANTNPITPPGGQGTVIDNVSDTSGESGREFFTIATPDENVFYLVIDRKKDSENVYFLNAVTESDLMALAEKDQETPGVSAIPDPDPVCSCTDKCAPGEVRTDCPVCILSLKNCTGKAPAADPDAETEPEKPEKDSGSTIILVVIAVLAAGGAGYYLKIYKPKKELADAEDFDDLTGGAEEPTVNEDDLPAPGQDAYPEPVEPQYPDSYEDDM